MKKILLTLFILTTFIFSFTDQEKNDFSKAIGIYEAVKIDLAANYELSVTKMAEVVAILDKFSISDLKKDTQYATFSEIYSYYGILLKTVNKYTEANTYSYKAYLIFYRNTQALYTLGYLLQRIYLQENRKYKKSKKRTDWLRVRYYGKLVYDMYTKYAEYSRIKSSGVRRQISLFQKYADINLPDSFIEKELKVTIPKKIKTSTKSTK